jgi:carotenoid cleavage dioxygenase
VPFFPLITDMEVLKRGGPYYRWHADQQSHFAIFPRRGRTSDIRWFRGPAVSAGHMMNAVTSGSKVHLDLCLYEGNCFEFFPSHDGSPWQPAPPMLTRLTFDLAGGADGYESRRLSNEPAEMPRCDDRYIGKPYRYGFMMCRPPGMSDAGVMALSAVGRLDHETGELQTWMPGKDSGVQEPVFVPRRQGSAEGDGYLLVPVNRYAENRCDLAVLDASRIPAGPVATLKLPVRLKGFHGSWVPAEARRTGGYVP